MTSPLALAPGSTRTPRRSRRSRRLESLDVVGTVAGATMTLRHGPDVFTDVFVHLQVDGAWWIANKVYHRAPAVSR